MTDEQFSKFRWNDHPVRVALKDTVAAVANVMFNKANMDGTGIFVSQRTLAEMLRVSERTVRRAQHQLESLELIHCEKRGNNMGRAAKASRFVLTMPPGTPDIDSKNTGHGTPDTDKNTGHGCPEHRTSVSGTPDTGVRLIDPLIDPGNKPGSVVKASIFDDRPDAPRPMRDQEINEHGPEGADALDEADIFDVRPTDGSDDQQESEPEPRVSVSSSSLDYEPNPPAEGNPMPDFDPFDPFASTGSVSHDSYPWPDAEPPSATPDPDNGTCPSDCPCADDPFTHEPRWFTRMKSN